VAVYLSAVAQVSALRYSVLVEEMTIRIVIEGEHGTAFSPFPISFVQTLSALSGRKSWKHGTCKFESSAANLRRINESGHTLAIEDKTGAIDDLASFDATADAAENSAEKPNVNPARSLRDYQKNCLAKAYNSKAYAILLEMGLGKTAIIIANAGALYNAGKLHILIVLAPKGPHTQWCEEQIPEHIDKSIPYESYSWDGKKPKLYQKVKRGDKQPLIIVTLNIDAVRTDAGYNFLEGTLNKHRGYTMMVVDEAHLIASYSAQRTRIIIKLGALATYRRILTGTPIARDVSNLYSQYLFLDPRILGHNTMASFKGEFCVINPETRQIVAQRNVERLFTLMDPYTFRLTKAEAIDLPEKIYARRRYEMSAETKRHYEAMKLTWMTKFEDGEIKDAQNGVVALLRLQQILCGHLQKEDGTIEEVGGGERIATLMEIVAQTEGQTLIWCRFTQDILNIAEVLSKEFGEENIVTYYGGLSDAQKQTNKLAFGQGGLHAPRFFIGNIGISAGLDGLQCASKEIFYSTSFSAIHRWQAEDRAHRIGQKNQVTIFDIVARSSIDSRILGNLRNKKSISDLTLDEIRMAVSGE